MEKVCMNNWEGDRRKYVVVPPYSDVSQNVVIDNKVISDTNLVLNPQHRKTYCEYGTAKFADCRLYMWTLEKSLTNSLPKNQENINLTASWQLQVGYLNLNDGFYEQS